MAVITIVLYITPHHHVPPIENYVLLGNHGVLLPELHGERQPRRVKPNHLGGRSRCARPIIAHINVGRVAGNECAPVESSCVSYN